MLLGSYRDLRSPIAYEQLIVDGAYKAKGVKNDYNVAVVFNPAFDPETVPSS